MKVDENHTCWFRSKRARTVPSPDTVFQSRKSLVVLYQPWRCGHRVSQREAEQSGEVPEYQVSLILDSRDQ